MLQKVDQISHNDSLPVQQKFQGLAALIQTAAVYQKNSVEKMRELNGQLRENEKALERTQQ